jgi:hypothetical protein
MHISGTTGHFGFCYPPGVTPHEQRLLEIETARVRYAWAKAQMESGGTTPALVRYLKESLDELNRLRASGEPLKKSE